MTNPPLKAQAEQLTGLVSYLGDLREVLESDTCCTFRLADKISPDKRLPPEVLEATTKVLKTHGLMINSSLTQIASASISRTLTKYSTEHEAVIQKQLKATQAFDGHIGIPADSTFAPIKKFITDFFNPNPKK